MSDRDNFPPDSDLTERERADLDVCRHYLDKAEAQGGTLSVGAPGFYRRYGKRLFDLCAGSVLLVMASPLILVAWAAVRLSSRGPGFFAQDRAGRNGQIIRVFKLRSMYTNHDDVVDAKVIDDHQADGTLFKLEDDPRVTPVGRIIRKASIDELPQLLNVVRGDMSLVGPRPLMLHMVEPYPEINALRCEVPPGVTGEWQITERENDQSLAGMVKYDLHYVETCSFTTDLRILLKTVPTVMDTSAVH